METRLLLKGAGADSKWGRKLEFKMGQCHMGLFSPLRTWMEGSRP